MVYQIKLFLNLEHISKFLKKRERERVCVCVRERGKRENVFSTPTPDENSNYRQVMRLNIMHRLHKRHP